MSQLALPLRYRAAQGVADFFVSDANREAVRYLLDARRRWPVPVALLIGPPASGKSHLAELFVMKAGGALIDDAGAGADEEALFHAWNAAAPGKPLLIVAREEPRAWPVRLPDLASRLAATPHVVIGPPDDPLLAAVMKKRFRDLGVAVSPELIRFLLTRIERSFQSVADVVARLDAAALAGRRPVTIALARETLFAQPSLL